MYSGIGFNDGSFEAVEELLRSGYITQDEAFRRTAFRTSPPAYRVAIPFMPDIDDSPPPKPGRFSIPITDGNTNHPLSQGGFLGVLGPGQQSPRDSNTATTVDPTTAISEPSGVGLAQGASSLATALVPEQTVSFEGAQASGLSPPSPHPLVNTMASEKGLENMFGENNCFLNVVIQALWHLKHFRNKFIVAEAHSHTTSKACVFCALKDIFVHFQFGTEATVPPQVLRHALAALFESEKRFQMGSLDDAAEAFDAILRAIHNNVEGVQGGEDRACQPLCAAHKTFALSIIEVVRILVLCQDLASTESPSPIQLQCNDCGETSEPLSYNEFIHYVPSEALRTWRSEHKHGSFGKALYKITHSDLKPCPNDKACQSKMPVNQVLSNCPEIIALGIAWSTGTPTREIVEETLRAIDTSFNTREMFDSVDKPKVYSLQGCICYYGLHYVAFFKVNKKWYQYDDVVIREVGISWEEVIQKLSTAKWQPNVLFYEVDV